MSCNYFKTNFENIGQQEFLRPNVGYRFFFDIKKSNVFSQRNTIQLKYILKPLTSQKMPKGQLDQKEVLVDLANIERRYNNLINLEEVDQVGSDKNILCDGDIVIPKIQPQMGNIFLNIEHNRYVASTELLEYKILDRYDPQFLYYLITLPIFLTDLKRLEGGKTHRRINYKDLLKIQIPDVQKNIQSKIVKQIEPIINSIKILKLSITMPQTIIDKVFTREFKFAMENFELLSKINKYNSSLLSFANNRDIRFSAKFHREAGRFVSQQLKSISGKKIKHFISEPMVLGASISPSDYDENGDYFYISMADIKNWRFESIEAKIVSNNYSQNNLNKSVKLNDILIARSGEGTIGKVALIDDESLKGIFADFTLRIRLKNYNPVFAYYYFRTTYFQYLIEVHKKGLGNNTNVFPSQIQELPMLDISLEKQQRIVDEIKLELDKQEDIKDQIAEERKKIDEIIEKAII